VGRHNECKTHWLYGPCHPDETKGLFLNQTGRPSCGTVTDISGGAQLNPYIWPSSRSASSRTAIVLADISSFSVITSGCLQRSRQMTSAHAAFQGYQNVGRKKSTTSPSHHYNFSLVTAMRDGMVFELMRPADSSQPVEYEHYSPSRFRSEVKI
jgi:hypothetical protein